jgi:hypothetical protein
MSVWGVVEVPVFLVLAEILPEEVVLLGRQVGADTANHVQPLNFV